MFTRIRRAQCAPTISCTSATSIPERWPTGEIEGHNPEYDFAAQPWPTEEGAFSFNIDPSPTKQFLRLHRDDAKTRSDSPTWPSRGIRDEELYDLRKDPEQLNNVADDASYATARQRLRENLMRN